MKKILSNYSSITSYGDCIISIEQSNGKVYGPWNYRVTDNGIMSPKNKKQEINETIRHLLEEEGKITIMVKVDNFLIKNKLRFKMNLLGFKEAEKYLK